MSARYILVAGDIAAEKPCELARLSAHSGLSLAFSSERIVAFVTPGCSCRAVANAGCIVGSLFHRHGSAEEIASISRAQATSVAGSEGKALLSLFWGGYVAAIETMDGVRIQRDPSGLLPCYYSASDNLLIFASDAELLAQFHRSIEIDLEEIGRQLYRAFVPEPTTALCGIRELLAGFSLRAGTVGADQEPFWSPWDYVGNPAQGSEGLTERLSGVVRHCVAAWASTRNRILLSVSGGLDSSILAACLSKSRRDAVCLTMFSDDPTGDERMFARALCNHLGLPLIEWPYRLEDIDIRLPLAGHLPRPSDRPQTIAYERVHLEVASEIGADAFMTGNGGDSVFGYSQSAVPIADLYLSRGFKRRTFAALLDVCRQTGCNIPDALREAWRVAHRSSGFRVSPKPLLLHSGFVRAIDRSVLHHPWLDAPDDALPGKAAHIASILRVQSHLEASRALLLPVLSPLMSQPIVETCLAIPSWEWRAGGRDRSVARRAFAADLPPAIVNRRVKGSPSGFAALLLDHFRVPIRERVLDGRLAAAGIIDRAAIETILAGERPVPHAERVRIFEMVNAEAWIDHWSNPRKPTEPRKPNIRSDGHGCPPSAVGPIP